MKLKTATLCGLIMTLGQVLKVSYVLNIIETIKQEQRI